MEVRDGDDEDDDDGDCHVDEGFLKISIITSHFSGQALRLLDSQALRLLGSRTSAS